MARSADYLRTATSESRSRGTQADGDHDDYDVTAPAEPVGRSYEEERDWRGAGALSLGILAGALVGAGFALLLAPQSGEETREQIARRARRLGTRADEGWDDLRDELRRLRRRSRRAATRGRWKVEDMLD
jgi:YtxH-like protein